MTHPEGSGPVGPSHAFALGRAKAGALGRESFGQIEKKGTEASLAGLCEDLVSKMHPIEPLRQLRLAKLDKGADRGAFQRSGLIPLRQESDRRIRE